MPSDHRTRRAPWGADETPGTRMHPKVAAVASLNWPSGNHLSFEPPRKHHSSLWKCSIYPLNLPTRFREDPLNKSVKRKPVYTKFRTPPPLPETAQKKGPGSGPFSFAAGRVFGVLPSDLFCLHPGCRMPYGTVTVVASRLTAVCASSLPLIDERFPMLMAV